MSFNSADLWSKILFQLFSYVAEGNCDALRYYGSAEGCVFCAFYMRGCMWVVFADTRRIEDNWQLVVDVRVFDFES